MSYSFLKNSSFIGKKKSACLDQNISINPVFGCEPTLNQFPFLIWPLHTNSVTFQIRCQCREITIQYAAESHEEMLLISKEQN